MSENDAMSAEDRLKMARDAAEAGRYAEALEGYVWFHHNALKENYELRGVRLSFALSYWMDLAGVYPPARQALKEIRDEKVSSLIHGADDLQLFKDVESINQYLGNAEATYDLFCAVNERNREFARECARVAMQSLVMARDFQLARSFIADPALEIQERAQNFAENMKYANGIDNEQRRSASIDAFMHNYVDFLKQLFTILAGAKSGENIDALTESAIVQITDLEVRERIRQKIHHNDSF